MNNSVLLQEAKEVLKTLLDNGFYAVFVGGYVRDSLMQRPIKDIDIATAARPDDVIRLFPRTAPTGLQHGTVTVVMRHNVFEVTTFRKESEYEQFRRPQSVEFISDLEEDLRRRDFTINAMALDINGNVIDPFGGAHDIESQTLRCVGDPVERFKEDALRMMRCVRFAAEYKLSIDSGTWGALLERATTLRHIALERVRAELERIVEGRDPAKGLRLFVESGLYKYIKHDVFAPYQSWDALEFTWLDCMRSLESGEQKWALLFIIAGLSGEKAEWVLKQLTFSNKKTEHISRIVKFHHLVIAAVWDNTLPAPLEQWWKTEIVSTGKTVMQDWLQVISTVYESLRIENEAVSSTLSILIANGQKWMQEVTVLSIKDLAIGGKDLSNLDKKPGPWMSKLLKLLLVDVALNRISNDRSSLLQQANYYLAEMDET